MVITCKIVEKAMENSLKLMKLENVLSGSSNR